MRRLFDGLAILAITVLGPAGLHADDRQIAQEIVSALQEQERYGTLEDFSIDLHVRNGEVRLKGRVARAEDEQLAVDIAQQVEGVELVYNDLEIAPAAGRTASEAPSALSRLQQGLSQTLHRASNVQLASHRTPATDQDNSRKIAEDIIGQLRAEMKRGNLKGFGVDVSVDGGTVTLDGRVSSEKQRQLALDIARGTPGAKRVVDRLEVSGNGRAVPTPASAPRELNGSDAAADDLAKSVVTRLRQQKSQGNLKDFAIDVNVVDGVVWLSGVVANKDQMNVALDQARYVRGVKAVVNDLKVGNSSELAQTALQQPASASTPSLLSPPSQMPLPIAHTQPVNYTNHPGLLHHPGGLAHPGACSTCPPGGASGGPLPMGAAGLGMGAGMYDHPQLPAYAWPSYAPYPNYGAVTYPRQYSAQAWPYIGPFYPYPQVPLGWRKVTLEWDDGWWMLDFKSR